MKVATLDFITQIPFSTPGVPHLTIAQGHNVSLTVVGPLSTILIMFMDKSKAQCVLCSNSPRGIPVFL